jgi:hypothetical protein
MVKHLGLKRLGSAVVREISVPTQTTLKNTFPPKPNHLRNKFDTTPDPLVFPPQTNNFQKPVRFVSAKGDVVGEKKGEKPREKPREEPQLKPKPRPVRFHCGYCGRGGHKEEVCFKRKREERMAKEWVNKDSYHPSRGVPESLMPLPRGKAIVHMVPARGDRSALNGRDPDGRFESSVKAKQSDWFQNRSNLFGGSRVSRLHFVLMEMVGLVPLVVVQVVGVLSQVAVSLLEVLEASPHQR